MILSVLEGFYSHGYLYDDEKFLRVRGVALKNRPLRFGGLGV